MQSKYFEELRSTITFIDDLKPYIEPALWNDFKKDSGQFIEKLGLDDILQNDDHVHTPSNNPEVIELGVRIAKTITKSSKLRKNDGTNKKSRNSDDRKLLQSIKAAEKFLAETDKYRPQKIEPESVRLNTENFESERLTNTQQTGR